MSDTNEKAEVILIVIKRVLKWIAVAAGVLVGLAIVLFLLLQFGAFVEEKYREREVSLVPVKVSYGEFEGAFICTKDFPYLFAVKNESKKTVNSIEFSVKITRKGFSSRINGSGTITIDKILAPGETWEQCFSQAQRFGGGASLNEKDVVVEVDYLRVVFKED